MHLLMSRRAIGSFLLGVGFASLGVAQSAPCYTMESLQGTYAVVNTYGSNQAMGLQVETLDGRGSLTRTGILNQPTVGSTSGERTLGNVTSTGTYSVNCNGTGTITRVVTRPDGTTASAADDFVITESVEVYGRLIATVITDAQRDPSVIIPGGVFVTRTHTLLPYKDGRDECYSTDSLAGIFGVQVHYGDNIALGIQTETLDSAGNLARTGVLNQPVATSSAGARTVANVSSTGTYSVNCDGTGTITRLVTRPDGTAATASDDFLITGAVRRNGRLVAVRVVDVQRESSVILPGGVFVTRVHTLAPQTRLTGFR